MTNKQGILIGALGSYFNELIAENLRPISTRLDNLVERIGNHSHPVREEYVEVLSSQVTILEAKFAKLEEKLDADFAWGRQAIHKIEELSELEKRVKMIDTRTANLSIEYDLFPEHAANLVLEKLGGMGLGINQLSIYVESEQFRERIFTIVDMALQQATLSIKGSE